VLSVIKKVEKLREGLVVKYDTCLVVCFNEEFDNVVKSEGQGGEAESAELKRIGVVPEVAEGEALNCEEARYRNRSV